MLEVCVDSLESANNAINGGADELEVCSALNDGGLTPSMGLVHEIQLLLKQLPEGNRPKLNVMIRCRGGDDFIYSDEEMSLMLLDLDLFKEMGVDQFVFGALTENEEIDESNCMTLLAAASPNKVTFSRAVDLTREIKRSVGIILGLGFYRVLTSGHRLTVNHPGAAQNISYLVDRYSNENLIIMPGAGVTPRNVHTFINMGSKIVHSTCRNALKLPRIEYIFRLGVTRSNYVFFSDYDVVCQMKEAIAAALEEKNSKK